MRAEHTGIHLLAETVGGQVEHRSESRREVDAQVLPAVERLTADQTHVVGVVGEETESAVSTSSIFSQPWPGSSMAEARRSNQSDNRRSKTSA